MTNSIALSGGIYTWEFFRKDVRKVTNHRYRFKLRKRARIQSKELNGRCLGRCVEDVHVFFFGRIGPRKGGAGPGWIWATVGKRVGLPADLARLA
jgi:hypothetical protein